MVAAKEYKSKNAARRAAKKQQKAAQHESSRVDDSARNDVADKLAGSDVGNGNGDVKIEQELKPSLLDEIAIGIDEEALQSFKAVFDKFSAPAADTHTSNVRLISSNEQGQRLFDEDDNIPDEEDMLSDTESAKAREEEQQLSKNKRRKANRLNIAELKQLVKHPELVEPRDVDARDPKLLLTLKAVRNTVPVPAHWSEKRDYLSGKRGLEKTAYELPDFIRSTGVGEMRQAAQEQREQQTLKQQMRARVQPKMGRLDIDYQKLHDAFFRFQTKPYLTRYGETYYEGKEFETNIKEKRPGELSEELIEALNIPPGAPPPWLISMQRFGPPPSYPSLKIPGLNAPIPSGGQWGFHPGGWGKPPMDDYGKPLYGDVYGIIMPPSAPVTQGIKKETELWGELQIVEESSDEEEEDEEEGDESSDEEEEDEEEGDDDEDGEDEGEDGNRNLDGEAMTEGIQTASGMMSMDPAGLETPAHIELRKARPGQDDDDDDDEDNADGVPMEDEEIDVNRPKALYQVLPERQQNAKGFYGSSHSYAVPDSTPITQQPKASVNESITRLDGRESKRRTKDDVQVAIDPATLEAGLSKDELEAAYDKGRAEKLGRPSGWDEDLSDMVSEAAAQAQRRKKQKTNPQEKKKEKFNF